MLRRVLIIFPIFLLVFSTAFPQGRGGRQGRQQGQRQSQGQGGVWDTGQAEVGQMEQKRIHTTRQQRDQMHSCNKLADGIQKQARKMAQASGNQYNVDEAIQQQNQIQNQFRTMEQEHEQLVNGLNSTQNQAWREQINNMNQLRQQLNLQLQQMSNQLNSGNPDSKQIKERAKEIEKIMNNWRKEYSTMSLQTDGF